MEIALWEKEGLMHKAYLRTIPNCTQKAWMIIIVNLLEYIVYLHWQVRADPLHDPLDRHTLVAVLVAEGTYPFKQLCVATVPSSLGVVAGL